MPNSLHQYLQANVKMRKQMRKQHPSFAYYGMEDFLLKHGQDFQYAPLPKGVKPGTPKLCFENAFRLARRRHWWYVEGMADSGVIPVHHAWVVNPEQPSIVIDPTWEHGILLSRKRFYIGVPFNLAAIAKARKRMATMLDDWQGEWPLFTGKILESEWAIP
jgi:hypothetical protein